MYICMVKASKTCLTADANYGLTGLLYAQTNTTYRFYVYDLVIDDAPAIIYASIGHCKIWDQQICLWAHRVEVPFLAKKNCPNLTNFFLGRYLRGPHADRRTKSLIFARSEAMARRKRDSIFDEESSILEHKRILVLCTYILCVKASMNHDNPPPYKRCRPWPPMDGCN